MNQTVDVKAVLAARDRRAACQQELLTSYGRPLISFTMNIAGPVKRTALIERGFDVGLSRLETQLRACHAAVLHRQIVREDTGCEAIYVVDFSAARLKELCVALEECDDLGRLYDLDVLDCDGTKLQREVERGCLICGKSGKGCRHLFPPRQKAAGRRKGDCRRHCRHQQAFRHRFRRYAL